MDPYKKAMSFWKFECYRLHVAKKQNEEHIRLLDEKIQSLESRKTSMQSAEIVPFGIRDGKSTKHLKELLQLDDDVLSTINVTYKPPTANVKRSSRYFMKLLEVLFT